MASMLQTEQPVGARGMLRCWGAFTLTDCRSGTDLRPRGRKTRAMVAYLALHPGKPVGRERLMGLLWGDRGEEQARASLRQAIHELKGLNGELGLLAIERSGLTSRPGALDTDIEAIRRAAVGGDFSTLLEMAPEPGEHLFADCDGLDSGFDDWLALERARQSDALIALLQKASSSAARQGATAEARALGIRLHELDPSLARPGRIDDIDRTQPAVTALPLIQESNHSRHRTAWLTAVIALVLLMAGVLAFASWRRAPPLPPTAIAVLPFASLPVGDASFAEGLSEEITAQLARQPGLRVAGRTSSRQFADRTADLPEIGRKLGVRYVLEGSVRAAGNRVRVNVALAQASNGLQLWSETFDGTRDDMLDIQHRIGTNVAEALGRKLAGLAPPTGALATSGAVYSLYLGAVGLIRERDPLATQAAKKKLVRAVALDPNFAPGWAGLAQATQQGGNMPGPDGERERAKAVGYAKRALALAPDLAHAHGVLGMLLGFEDPVGQFHVKRAAALDPGNAEYQFWLGHVLAGEADFARMLGAYRRAFEIDPLWSYAQISLIESAWTMGERRQASGYLRRIERDGSRHQAHLARAAHVGAQGDFSARVVELTAAAAATGDPGKKAAAAHHRAFVFCRLGFYDAALNEWSKVWDEAGNLSYQPARVEPLRAYFALRQGKLPSIAELRARDAGTYPADPSYARVGAKLLINAGRSRDVLAVYGGADGFLGVVRGRLPENIQDATVAGPIVAAALRAAGRGPEADQILARLDDRIAAALARNGGRATSTFLAHSAPVWAMRGKGEAAISALERAAERGWAYVEPNEGDTALADIGEEPAFRTLRGLPRFERLRERLRTHLDRERREVAGLLPGTIR